LFSVQIADEKAEKKQEEMRYKTRTTQKKGKRKRKRGAKSWGGPADERKTRAR
jgi:hypothetical protein